MAKIIPGDNMNHEIDLEKYAVHTDLAIDYVENKEFNEVKLYGNIKVTNTVLDEIMAKEINKKAGRYITIQFNDITDYSNREEVKKVFTSELKKLLKLDSNSKVLIVGLGNSKSTPDALGPLVIDNILITNHLFEYSKVEDGFIRTYGIKPGVLASTGIETSDFVKGIVDEIKPNLLVVIDALASGSIDRVNKTIQITDTGISPGGGIGNKRKEISYETLGIDVIAIGVPTVVDAVTIVSDTINYIYKHYSYNKMNINNPKNKLISILNNNYLKEDIEINENDKKNLLGIIGNFKEEELKELIFEVLTPIGYNLIVTPKEIDFIVEILSDIISSGINASLHDNVDNL